MKNINRKAISFILAIAMMISLIPTNVFVFATDETTADTTTYGTVTATLMTESDFILFSDGSESATSTTVTGDARATFPTQVKVVDYYGGFDASFSAYKVEPVDGEWPAAYADYTWVKYPYLTDWQQEDIEEDEALIGKTLYINPPVLDEDGLYKSLYLHETPDPSPMDAYSLSDTEYAAVYTITDVFKTAWCELYQLTTADAEIKEWVDGLWISADDVELITEETMIRGQVNVIQYGEIVTDLYLAEGEKEYVFTTLGEEIGDAVSYQWQVLIDEENGRWANVYDYIHPYAVISEALIKNVLSDQNYANMRCVVTTSTGKYVSSGFYVWWEGDTAEVLAMDDAATEDDAAAVAMDTTDTNEFHIQIEYRFNHATNANYNGQQVGAPLVITLPTGTKYDNTVTFPPEVGYQTYIAAADATKLGITGEQITYNGDTYVSCDSYKFSDQGSNFNLTVYYIPRSDTQFRVRYYHQNLNDDNYTYGGDKFYTGVTHATVGDQLAIEVEGFMALAYDAETLISGDGSTIVDIYYDRQYYLVDVDLSAADGSEGYGVVPRYVRYGTQITMGEPTNPGFTFAGWTLVSMDGKEVADWTTNGTVHKDWTTFAAATTAASVITVKHYNLLYKANWTKQTVQYTVVYWKENVNDDGYSFFTYETKSALAGDTVTWNGEVPNTDAFADINCFTLNVNKSDTEIVVKGDGSSVINVYYRRNVYTLQFKATGACVLAEHTHGTDCNTELICGLESHTHTEAECGTPTLTCDIEEGHKHSDACCNYVHIHDQDCFDGVNDIGDEYTGNRTANVDTSQIEDGYVYVYRQNQNQNRYRYIYINGVWYECDAWIYNSTQLTPNASCPGEHVHGDGYCTCTTPEHTHIDSCYTYTNCTNKGHVHDENCYSECTLIEHTHDGYYCTNTYATNVVYYITAKYQADIRELFPNQKLENTDIVYTGNTDIDYTGFQWRIPSNSNLLNGTYVLSLDRMLGESLTFTYDGKGNSAKIYYYIEMFPEETSDIKKEYGGETKYFEQWKLVYLPWSGALTYAEEFHSIEGFTQWTSDPVFATEDSTPRVQENNYMYYSRNQHQLRFKNNGDLLEGDDWEKDIYYDQPMDAFEPKIAPPLPSGFEDNSYTFAGWYTTPTCVEGTEYDFATETMPDADVMLFAKWVPTTWSVKVYRDLDTSGNPIDLVVSDPSVPFGSFFPDPELTMKANIPEDSKYNSLTFNGWYYKDVNGDEQRFDFNSMQIKQDYVIYAKWISTTPVAYTIYYYEEGTGEQVAEPEHGVGLAGLVRVFEAKVGEELDPEYQTGWFPTVRSHGLELSLEEANNVYTFYYKQPTSNMTVTVYHVFTDDGLATYLGTDNTTFTYGYLITVQTTDSAKLTIRFDSNITTAEGKAALIQAAKTAAGGSFANGKTDNDFWSFITSLSPNVYQQELIVVAAENADNEVTFEWESKTGSVLCEILYQFETVDSTDANKVYVTEYVQRVEMKRGFTYSSSDYWQEFVGFTLNEAESTASITIASPAPADGTLESYQMVLKYDRQTYEYTVVHSGTNIANETKYAKYGAIVTEYAQTPEDYYVVGATSQTEEIVSNGQQIVFNYGLQQISYSYISVGDSMSGLLDPFYETIYANAYREGSVGSVPTAYTGYRFVGWFTDEACTAEVDSAYVDSSSNKLTPPKPTYDPTELLYTVTYYAKFVPSVTSLTITNTNITVETDQPIIYNVSGMGNDGTSVAMTVAVVGNTSVTITNLPIGDYTVDEQNLWSWRYGNQAERSITLVVDETQNVLTFDYSAVTRNDQWLSDNYAYTYTYTSSESTT